MADTIPVQKALMAARRVSSTGFLSNFLKKERGARGHMVSTSAAPAHDIGARKRTIIYPIPFSQRHALQPTLQLLRPIHLQLGIQHSPMAKDGYPTRREPLCKKLQSLGDPLSLKQRLDALKKFQINHVYFR